MFEEGATWSDKMVEKLNKVWHITNASNNILIVEDN
jgi:hypothetical protein